MAAGTTQTPVTAADAATPGSARNPAAPCTLVHTTFTLDGETVETHLPDLCGKPMKEFKVSESGEFRVAGRKGVPGFSRLLAKTEDGHTGVVACRYTTCASYQVHACPRGDGCKYLHGEIGDIFSCFPKPGRKPRHIGHIGDGRLKSRRFEDLLNAKHESFQKNVSQAAAIANKDQREEVEELRRRAEAVIAQKREAADLASEKARLKRVLKDGGVHAPPDGGKQLREEHGFGTPATAHHGSGYGDYGPPHYGPEHRGYGQPQRHYGSYGPPRPAPISGGYPRWGYGPEYEPSYAAAPYFDRDQRGYDGHHGRSHYRREPQEPPAKRARGGGESPIRAEDLANNPVTLD